MNKTYFKFSVLQWFFWCSRVSFPAFAAVYFSSVGLTTSQIGFALSISTMAGVIGQIFWGYLSDRKRCLKGLTIGLLLSVIIVVLSFSIFKSYQSILLFMAILGFVQMILPSFLDTWILNALAEKASDYSLIRQWGSLGYCILSLFYGKIIETLGVNIMFVFAVVTGLTTVTMCIIIKKPTPHVKDDKGADKSEASAEKLSLGSTLKKLYSNKRYKFILVVIFFISLASCSSIAMIPIITRELKGSDTLIGIVIFVSVITEVVAFRLNGRLSSRFNAKQCFLVVCAIWATQYIVIIMLPNVYVYMVVVLLQGLANGFYIMNSRLYLAEISQPEIRSTAISYAEIPTVAASSIGVAISGVLIENFGVVVMTVACLCYVVIGGTILFFSIKKDKITESI